MSVPDRVREHLKLQLWKLADEIGWTYLSPSAKSKYYENWTLDPKIGGVLAHYIDKGQVRVYLKDTVLKDYSRERSDDEARPFRILRIPQTARVLQRYIKPHGRRLNDGRIICWGRAADWKSILLAAHERVFTVDTLQPFAVLLTHATGRFQDQSFRSMVEDAARKLGIERLIWVDTLA